MMKLNSNVTTMMMRCHQHPLNVQIKKKWFGKQMDDMLYICNKVCSIIINSWSYVNVACSIIINSRSYVNVASIILIRNLNLNTIKYYRPYRKYHDKILCDVVSMQASPLLLKRSWQFDSKVACDGFKNKYFFL
jgi:hypothetical protein